jgi:hypothetical protein
MFALVAIGTCLPALAVTHEYAIEMPNRVPIKYRVELPLQHAGELLIEATWEGRRTVALRLDPPEGRPLRRAGPSPQALRVDVDAASVEGSWTLTVQSMATTGSGHGTLRITLPEAAPTPTADSPAGSDAAAAGETWRQPPTYPRDLQLNDRRLYDTIERFRSIVVYDSGGSPPDACRWHDDLLKYLTEQRDLTVGGRITPVETSQRLLQDLAESIDRVEEFRTSTDSVISGPPPEDRDLRAAWIRVRRDRLQELEGQLDELLGSVHRGHAPELEKLAWPARMVSCLIACQRHFEERVRVGERNAINWELAQTQWDVLLSAGEALRNLNDLHIGIAQSHQNQE